MRKLAVVLVALCAASPTLAQTPPAPAQGASDDLRCAAWAAVALGLNKDKPEVVQSLTGGLAWFLGRYEGETGKKFEDGMTADYLNRIGPDLPAADAHCRARIQEMGHRLIDWGEALQKSAPASVPKAPAG